MTVHLAELPYDYDALAPHISETTLRFHHDKHHRKYVDTLNELVKSTDLAAASLEEILRRTATKADAKKIFNNAAQVWNHTFYWHSLRPGGGGDPDGALADLIRDSFGDIAKFKKTFRDEAAGHFGSGWAWLVRDGKKLKVVTTHDADLPLVHGHTALLTVDLWEHAYYLDVQNRRPDYLQGVLDHLLNWDFAHENLVRDGESLAFRSKS